MCTTGVSLAAVCGREADAPIQPKNHQSSQMTGSPLHETQALLSGPWEPDAQTHDSCLPSVTSTETNWTDTWPCHKPPCISTPKTTHGHALAAKCLSVHSQLCSVWSFPLMPQKTNVFLLSPPWSAQSGHLGPPRSTPRLTRSSLLLCSSPSYTWRWKVKASFFFFMPSPANYINVLPCSYHGCQ